MKIAASRQAGIFAENMAEATAACLFAMVQGNLAAVGLGHLIVASQTGLLAGFIAGISLLLAKTRRHWLLAIQLGIATMLADFLVHYLSQGTVTFEPIATGLIAMLLSYVAATAWTRWQHAMASRSRNP
ncbi:MAG: hypothetical protein RL120_02670 [Gammaproteobacteria bacterium]